MSRIWWRAASALALAVTMTACNEESNDEAAIEIVAADDAATVVWNSASQIDVLGNDSATRGAITLSAVGQPAHGTATIASGRLSYTPVAGYFGPDSVAYTVAADDGTTKSATASISVRASLTVEGALAGGPWDGATVSATVGARQIDAAVDTGATTSGGTFRVVVETADPAEVISLRAIGNAERSGMALRSLLGDAGSVARAAGAGGRVSAAQYPSVNLSPLSTALAAMFEEGAASVVLPVPVTQASIAAYTVRASTARLDELATAVKLVNDLGVALPAGVANSVALIDHPSTSLVLADFMAAQVSADGRYTEAAIEDRLRPTGAQPLASAGPQTILYFTGHRKSSFLYLQVTYASDGTATVLTGDGARTATWSIADGAITLLLASPFEFDGAVPSPGSYEQVAARGHITGFTIAQLTGTNLGGIATFLQRGSYTVQEGPSTGLEVPFDSLVAPATAVVSDLNQLAASPLSATEFAGGAQWGGLIVGDSVTGAALEDTLVFAADGRATAARTGLALTWSVSNGVLVVSGGGQERAYQRLLGAAPSGEEQWLVTERVAGQPASASVQMVARLQPGLAFAADGTAARLWQSGISEGLYFDLATGGAGNLLSQSPGNPQAAPQPIAWAIATDGRLSITPADASGPSPRDWFLVGRQGGAILVNEHLVSADLWRLNIYTDAGPSTESAASAAVKVGARPAAVASIRAATSLKAVARQRAGRAAG